MKIEVDPPAFRRAVAGLPETDVLVVSPHQVLTVLDALARRSAGVSVSASRGLWPKKSAMSYDMITIPSRISVFADSRFSLRLDTGPHFTIAVGRLTINKVDAVDLNAILSAAAEKGSTVREVMLDTPSPHTVSVVTPLNRMPLINAGIEFGCWGQPAHGLYHRLLDRYETM